VKKAIGLVIGCILGGCETPHTVNRPLLETSQEHRMHVYSHQDTAPLPWVSVVPSERAIEYQEVNFGHIARHLRRMMAIDSEKFKCINLVLIDYTVLEPTPPHKELTKKKYGGQLYCKKYIRKPERYFLKLSFYDRKTRPPAPPLYEGTAVMNVTRAFPTEALSFMIEDIIYERLRLMTKKIHVDLD